MVQRGRKSSAQLADIPMEPAVHRHSSLPKPPCHLGEPERQIWRHVFEDFELATRTAEAVLTSALEAHQRARECREAITREGMTVAGRDGQVKVHPLIAAERDARGAFLTAIRVLGLEL
jgi:P27 family predicted phage terminase small subunit